MKRESYVDATMTPGEQVKYRAKVHPALYVSMIPIFVVLEALFMWTSVIQPSIMWGSPSPAALIFIPLPFLVFAQSWLVIHTTELALTDRRIVSKTGIITTKTFELQIEKVESIEFEQGLFGRMLNYGTVTVKGTGVGAVPAPGIMNPLDFRKAVQELTKNSSR